MPAVRRAYASGGPLQQPPAEVVFDHLDLAGYRRLGNVQAFGGAAEAACLKHDEEKSELFDHDSMVMRNSHRGNRQSALPARGPRGVLSGQGINYDKNARALLLDVWTHRNHG